MCFFSFALRFVCGGETLIFFGLLACLLALALRFLFGRETRFLFRSTECFFNFALRFACGGETRVFFGSLACLVSVALCFSLDGEMLLLFSYTLRFPCRGETRLCHPASHILCRRLTSGLITVAMRFACCCETRLLGTTGRFIFAVSSPFGTHMPFILSTVLPSAQGDHDDRGRERKTYSADDDQHLHDW